MPVIELKDVVVTYGARRALDGVSFTLDGGAVGLLGPNGAGKSTLLKTLLGFKRAASGEVRVFDRVLPGEALTVRQRLGYMPEREVVSPKASAVSFLTYCGQIFGMTRVDAMERAHEVLNYVGLADSRYRPMETYSTGMLQRVKFGQALVHDPRLLLLDEPTNGLDPEGRLEMLELIRELTRKRKVTVLLSSHLLPDIEHVCDRVVVIDRGRVLKDGYIKDLTAPRRINTPCGFERMRAHSRRRWNGWAAPGKSTTTAIFGWPIRRISIPWNSSPPPGRRAPTYAISSRCVIASRRFS